MNHSIFFTLFLLLTTTFLKAQPEESHWAIVQDSDGFSNVRKGAGTSFEVIGKANHGDFVWVVGTADNNWKNVFANEKEEQLWGYIHGSRLKPLGSLESLPETVNDGDFVAFSGAGIAIELGISDFDSKKQPVTIVRFPDGGEAVKEIDFLPVIGTDGTMPLRQYSKATLTIDGKSTDLLETAFKNLFNPDFEDHEVLKDPNTNTLYITGMNSDGAGTYVFLIRIVDGKYKDRVILHIA